MPDSQKAAALLVIRREFALLGIDVSDLTDEQIEESVERFAQVARSAGITAEEASEALQSVGRAIRGSMP
jgi:hypothetical protein